ncbi:MAG: protein phosphatase 2C domain-containing protein [Bryobacteraceae bacterium]|jgi:serine/threonine protein phosphatase PrpC
MSTVVTWRSATASDPGLRRDRNEDRVWADDARGAWLVVDGLGGHPAGDRAAEIAIQTIPKELAEAGGGVEERVRQAITAANNRIYEAAQADPECHGMACVLTLAVLEGQRITVGHVGDSRLYLVWNGVVRKITPDHSPVGVKEDRGEISELDAMRHPRRNEVFRDAGTRWRTPEEEGFIEVRGFLFHADAAMLLCTDGLSDALTSAEIGAIVDEYDGDAARTAAKLVEAANGAGGVDNISVVFVAGPEFVGSASPRMAEARARHAITRPLGRGWARLWWRRFPWLLAGLAAGMGSWAALERVTPIPRPPAPHVIPASPETLTKALGAAHAGDTIQLAPGHYRAPVRVPNGVALAGPKTGDAVIDGAPASVAPETKQ